jgi:hypothetical protein
MADFYVAPPLEFDVPNGHAFFMDPAVVFVKTGCSCAFAHPTSSPILEHQTTSAIVHPSANSRFTKSVSLSPIMTRQRNVVG